MDEILKIVPMATAHVSALAEIERLCFAEPWSEESLRQELDNPCADFLVALAGGEVAGYAGLFIVAGDCSIANLAVVPEYRRRGVASALLEAAESRAKSRDCDYITLEVRRSNAPATALYESRGFTIVGERKNFYRNPDEDAVIMTKYFGDDRQ